MADEQATGVLFRASKRRKVLRKPAVFVEPDEEHSGVEASGTTITKHVPEQAEEDGAGVTRALKRGGTRKHGIAFSSSSSYRNAESEDGQEQALMVVNEEGSLELPGNDRFVKPKGRVDVIEDKHMMAYVDSKLAEIRPQATPPASTFNQHASNGASANDGLRLSADIEANEPRGHPVTTPGGRTYQQAQERTNRVYQRPPKRRPRPTREQTDVARDSMIEQIMGEGQVPHYDRSVSGGHVDEGDGVDHDEAAAEAFKAQLLADLQQNRRRPAASKNAATTSTGPKLGGSRSQREKMKAIEEAKGASGKK